jgi:hypothetical protein
MSTKGVLQFIDDLSVNFSFRKDWDEEREKNWSTLMVRELGGYSDDILARACREIILTRGKRQGEQWMPTIAECLNACKEAKYWIEAEKQKQSLPLERKKTASPYSPERKVFVRNHLLRSEIGKRAANEGWARALQDFCRVNNRLPDQREAEKLIKASQETFEIYEGLLRKTDSISRVLAETGRLMMEREKALADFILHGVVLHQWEREEQEALR